MTSNGQMTLEDYLRALLDDEQPLQSHFESDWKGATKPARLPASMP